ncbi:hypothetical protein D3C76_1102700 [compost metagenome]
MLTSLFDGDAIEFLRIFQATFDQRLFEAQRATEKTLAPGPLGQFVDGFVE